MKLKKLILTTAMLGVSVLPARAEIVFFNTGRNLSVDSHRVDGDKIVMAMRGGGEMTLDASLVSHIEPDEVPYPEPPPAAPPVDVTPLAAAIPNLRLEPHPRFDSLIQKVAKEQGIDATLVRAVIQVESG